MTWVDRHEYYTYLCTSAQNNMECDHLLGQLSLRRPAEFVAFVLSYVREMMGADELIEGQNSARRSNLDDVAIPLVNVEPIPRWVAPPPWSGGHWHGLTPTAGPHQTTLEDWWGAMSIRNNSSSLKGVKKQTMITRWIHKDTKADHVTKKDITQASKTGRDTV